MKRYILSIFAFCAIMAADAAPITWNKAAENVRAFLNINEDNNLTDGKIKMYGVRNEIKPYYIFNIGNNKGFVIASGDDTAYPILGYVTSGEYDPDKLPENMKYWLDSYSKQISAIQKLNIRSKRAAADGDVRKNIPILITARWNQSDPFNMKCPSFNGSDRCVVGCVATALAQVMYFHRWPAGETTAIDAYSYVSDEDGQQKNINALPATTFKWDLMADLYNGNEFNSSKEAVAELMQYCGHSVKMNYGVNGSGALSENLTEALIKNFGYSTSARFIQRQNYSTQKEWDDLIYNELLNNRPVLYGGVSNSGGHQFVCDGYFDGYFHINWGWGGISDGYFKLSALDPSIQGIGGSDSGYNAYQDAVIGIERPIGADNIFVNEVRVSKGEAFDLDVYLNNYIDRYTSMQMDIELPEGIELIQDENGDIAAEFMNERSKNGNHKVSINRLKDGNYRLVAYSPDNSMISGNNGVIIKIPMKLASSMDFGRYKACIKNIEICDTKLVTYQIRDCKFSIVITDGSETPGVWSGYYNGDFDDVTYVGFGVEGTYNCAVKFFASENSIFAKRIGGIRFALNNLNNIDNVSVWVSNVLPANPQEADIIYKSITKAELYDLMNDRKYNEVFFETPYQILHRDIYVGYSFTVTQCLDNAEKYPVVVYGDKSYSNSMLIKFKDGEWNHYSGQDLGILAEMIYLDDNGYVLPGDVNYDKVVDVLDVSSIVKHIANENVEYFSTRAADIDVNGSINIVDAASTIDIVLERYEKPKNDVCGNNDLMLARNSSQGTEIFITGDGRYKAFQMDVTVKDGNDISEILIREDIASTFTTYYKCIGENKYRITVVSLTGHSFCPTNNALITIKSDAEVLGIDNIIFATEELCEKHFKALCSSDITGIEETYSDENDINMIYTLQGVRIGSDAKALTNGVYIINGKKVIIK